MSLTSDLCDKRKFFRVGDSLQIQIHVEIRPIQMLSVMKFDMEELLEGGGLEPWKVVNTQKIFAAANQQPEPVRRHV